MITPCQFDELMGSMADVVPGRALAVGLLADVYELIEAIVRNLHGGGVG